ncbi:PrpF domain-containing protein [Devosia sp. 2618]|uniref:2-methylaconitate cis-trans isomerase PrpF family protein n=1 Tax=Devosia sp. 2618 TaxID=3156454 RepID=UPI0033911313
MSQTWIPAYFYRGGSSKGVFFKASDLPSDRDAIERILLSVMGSPDPYGRQLNGMGGGLSSLSKAVILSPSGRDDCDVDYLFAQVSVDRGIVEWGANCGNLSSAVGPCAIEMALIAAVDDEAHVRIYQVNTDKIIHARFKVRHGAPVTAGDFVIAGVAGSGARIALDFIQPGGTRTSGLLPTGRVVDLITIADAQTFNVSLVDATNPVVFVDADELGLVGTEMPDQLEGDPQVMAKLDSIRRAGGVLMGLAKTPEDVGLAAPKIAMVSAPKAFDALDGRVVTVDAQDICVRMISMQRAHRAVPLTTAMCVGTASNITGTVVNVLSRASGADVRVGNPSGVLPVTVDVHKADQWHVDRTTAYRTARCLMRGEVAYQQP